MDIDATVTKKHISNDNDQASKKSRTDGETQPPFDQFLELVSSNLVSLEELESDAAKNIRQTPDEQEIPKGWTEYEYLPPNYIWRVVELAMRDMGPKHNSIDSYNRFVNDTIHHIVECYSPMVVESMVKDKLETHKFYFERLFFGKPHLIENTRQESGTANNSTGSVKKGDFDFGILGEKDELTLLTMKMCMDRNITYAAPMYLNIRHESYIDNKLIEVRHHPLEKLGELPILTKSDLCVSKTGIDVWKNCPYTTGAEYIIGGSRKTFTTPERMLYNYPMLYKQMRNNNQKTIFVSEIRSTNSIRVKSPSLLQVSLTEIKGQQCLWIDLPYDTCGFPLTLFLKLLGIDDNLMTLMCVKDLNDTEMRNLFLINLTMPHIMDQPMQNVDDALNYVVNKLCSDEKEWAKKVKYVEEMLLWDLLPHLMDVSVFGTDISLFSKEETPLARQIKLMKAHFICTNMAYPVMQAYLGRRDVDNRDHEKMKRNDTNGDSMKSMWNTYFKRMLKEIRKLIMDNMQKEKTIDFPSLLHSKHQMTSNLKFGVTQGKWTQKKTQTKGGITDTLQAINLAGHLSAHTKANTQIGDQGKVAKPRMYHTNSSKCVSDKADVLLSDGRTVMNIRDIINHLFKGKLFGETTADKEQIIVQTVNPDTLTKGTSTIYQPVLFQCRDWLRIKFTNGDLLEVTPDHPFLCLTDSEPAFINAEELTKQTRLLFKPFPNRQSTTHPLGASFDIWLFEKTLARLTAVFFVHSLSHKDSPLESIDLHSLSLLQNTDFHRDLEVLSERLHSSFTIDKDTGHLRLQGKLWEFFKFKTQSWDWLLKRSDLLTEFLAVWFSLRQNTSVRWEKLDLALTRAKIETKAVQAQVVTWDEFLEPVSYFSKTCETSASSILDLSASCFVGAPNRPLSNDELVFLLAAKQSLAGKDLLQNYFVQCKTPPNKSHFDELAGDFRHLTSAKMHVLAKRLGKRNLFYLCLTAEQVSHWCEHIGFAYLSNPAFELAMWKQHLKTKTGRELESFGSYLIVRPLSLTRKTKPIVVFDFTTHNNDHTFLPNGIVTHNCPSDTSEGSQCGLVKHFTYLTHISSSVLDGSIKHFIHQFPGFQDICQLLSYEQLRTTFADQLFLVMVNGSLEGYIEERQAKLLKIALMELRRSMTISFEVEIALDLQERVLRIHTDPGRSMQPVLIINPKTRQPYMSKEEICKAFSIGANWNHFLSKGFVEYLGTDELGTSYVAHSPQQLTVETHIPFTHLHFPASSLMSVLTASIPFSNHNPSPRLTYQDGMSKHSIGVPSLTFPSGGREAISYVLHYPQKSLTPTHISKIVGLEEMSTGQNVVLAINSEGWNQEDAYVTNQGPIDRGMHRATMYRMQKDTAMVSGSHHSETFKKPAQNENLKGKQAKDNYNLVEDDGLVAPGERVKVGDILACKTFLTKQTDARGNVLEQDCSMRNLTNKAVVDSVMITNNAEGNQVVQIRVYTIRKPIAGDKLCLTDKHEILTSQGWVRISEYTPNMRVLTPLLPTKDNHCNAHKNFFDNAELLTFDIDQSDLLLQVKHPWLCTVATLNHEVPLLNKRTGQVQKFTWSHIYENRLSLSSAGWYLLSGSSNVQVQRSVPTPDFSDVFKNKDQLQALISLFHPLKAQLSLSKSLKIFGYDYRSWLPHWDSSVLVELLKTLERVLSKEGLLQINAATQIGHIFGLSKEKLNLWSSVLTVLGLKHRFTEGDFGNLQFYSSVTTTKRSLDVQQNTYYTVPLTELDLQTVTAGSQQCSKVYCLEVQNTHVFYVRLHGTVHITGNSTKHGQKGVIGHIYSMADSIWSSTSGIIPDYIYNPHAFPGRQTVGQFIEMLFGKGACLKGEIADGTPFEPRNFEEVRRVLIAKGFNPSGTEVFHNGRTGEKLHTELFQGVVYVQRLKHMVDDKIHARNDGPVNPLTRQPLEGRAREGGLRLGEMERDCYLAHGCVEELKSAYRNQSDPTTQLLCRHCGRIGYFNYQLKKFMCSNKTCIDKGNSLKPIITKYAFKTLVQELLSRGIDIKLYPEIENIYGEDIIN